MSARRTAVASAAVALLVLAGACGGNDEQSASATGARTDAAANVDAPADGPAKDVAGSAAVEGGAGAKVDAGKQTPTNAATSESNSDKEAAVEAAVDRAMDKGEITTDDLKGDFVFGSPRGRSADDPRPRSCTFKANEMCRLQIHGTYGLKTSQVADIHVGAYEDGASEASFQVTLPGAKPGSTHWYVDEFPYMARAGVKEMAILVKLVDPKSGKVLATGKPTKFTVGG